MRLTVAAAIACALACRGTPSTNPPRRTPEPRTADRVRPDPATWQTLVTPLEVVVLDDYRTRASCDGIRPRRLEIALDGAPRAAIDVPCSVIVHAPPRRLAAAAFDVPPGKHTLRVRDTETGLAAEAELELPVVEPPFGDADDDTPRALATKLPVWANEDELDIQGVRASLDSL